jgi:hypothetical protein
MKHTRDRLRRGVRTLFTPSQVNTALGVLLIVVLATGLASWALPDGPNGVMTTIHAIAGIAIVLLAPSKLLGPVRTGMRRRASTRWASVAFGISVTVALAFGIVHAIGAAYGVGPWSPLWTHQLFGLIAVPFALFHVGARPVSPRRHDLNRRAAFRFGGVAAGAALLHVAHGPARAALGATDRRATGSYELGSYDPARMPTVYWLNDRRPADTGPEAWRLEIQGRAVTIDELWAASRPVEAILDCTGGWFSAQRWDAVPLSELLSEPAGRNGRSVRVESITGYRRWYSPAETGKICLAVGYGGEPLRSGHGAPVRLVVPGRRGPEWVKWVVSVDDDARPAWASSPLPLS